MQLARALRLAAEYIPARAVNKTSYRTRRRRRRYGEKKKIVKRETMTAHYFHSALCITAVKIAFTTQQRGGLCVASVNFHQRRGRISFSKILYIHAPRCLFNTFVDVYTRSRQSTGRSVYLFASVNYGKLPGGETSKSWSFGAKSDVWKMNAQ